MHTVTTATRRSVEAALDRVVADRRHALDVARRHAAAAVRMTPEALDGLTRELTPRPRFADLIGTDESYRPTMRVDRDERFAVLAVAFDTACRRLGQSRRAYTPAHTECEAALLLRHGLIPA